MKFSETKSPRKWALPTNYEKLTGAERREVREQYKREQKKYLPFLFTQSVRRGKS